MGVLERRVALITGAASMGIGRGIARVLAEAGADVALGDRDPRVHAVADELAATAGVRARSYLVDVRDPGAVKGFVDAAAADLGGLDIVVANAGVWQRTSALSDSFEDSVAIWDRIQETNLRGVFLTGRAAIAHLVARGGGHIVNIATDHICPPPGYATGGGTLMDVYDASKWGINGLTQAWAKLLAPAGIRVNALCMDATESEMVHQAVGQRATAEMIATWMRPEQMGQLVLDLIAEGPDGRTGENIGAWLGHPVTLPPRREVLPSRHP
jgi:NAD(P)-dependent dehydrogenase (short-subunit alcohol dehydrogenase family)